MSAIAASRATRPASKRGLRAVVLAFACAALALLPGAALAARADAALTGVDLATYKRVGRFDLPEPTRTTPPANNLLAQEASGVTWDWDTNTLFIVGDGGTSITQVSKTGTLIDTMTLAPGGNPQGTDFFDTEGIAYIGNEEFVITEERERKLDKVKYVPNTEITHADARTVKLGTTIGNIGLEGVTFDRANGHYVAVKEIEPESIFETEIDWTAETASNGSPTTSESTDLFDPAKAGLLDFSDVYALTNLHSLDGTEDSSHLLIISQESGRIENVDREGNVHSSLALVRDAGNPLSIPDQTQEGVTMDEDGNLYVVNENGGGDSDHPQLWVFAPQTTADTAPTAVTLTNQTASVSEQGATAARLKLADVEVTDADGFGENDLSVTGPDAASFEVDGNGLYLKKGTVLNAATKATYTVSVAVDDPAAGGSPDATSDPYTLTVNPVGTGGEEAEVAVTEAAPWGSGTTQYEADWFELTNIGAGSVNLTNWKMDDSSNAFGSSVPLAGVTSLAPGHSAIFVEGDSAKATAFVSNWFPSGAPAGFQIGTYSGSGVGLSTGGDGVNVFDQAGEHVAGIAFPDSTASTGKSFDNAAGLDSGSGAPPSIAALSADGVNGAFTVGTEVGSPGAAPAVPTPVVVTEVAPWASGESPYGTDWFELTNRGAKAVDLTGWKMDDSSDAFTTAVPLLGVTTLAPGASAIFIEGNSTKIAAFESFWFGSSVPAGFQIGTYEGSGVGLSTGGDGVNVFNAAGDHITGVAFDGTAAPASLDNAAGLGSFGTPLPKISAFSVEGSGGAVKAHDEIASPGRVSSAGVTGPELSVTPPVFATQAAGTIGAGQWVTVTNEGDANASISTVAIQPGDRDSTGDFLLTADACSGATLAPGESCEVQIRFAPGRENATSTANLVIASNVAGSPTLVPLSATSSGLPQGPQGDPGQQGNPGAHGDPGAQGDQGPKGDTGARGPKGDTGAQGPQGPAGPRGPAGKNGKDGKDGSFEFTAKDASASVRRGRTAHFPFRLANHTTTTARKVTLRVDAPAALRLGGDGTVDAGQLKPGQSRSVDVPLAVGAHATPGRYRVTVKLTVGARTATRTVTVVVSG